MPMRKLRTCDFCGADADGVYEALPPELSPTEAEQRRILLCTDCAGTLETVMDPLLRRLGVDTEGDESTPPAEPPSDAAGERSPVDPDGTADRKVAGGTAGAAGSADGSGRSGADGAETAPGPGPGSDESTGAGGSAGPDVDSSTVPDPEADDSVEPDVDSIDTAPPEDAGDSAREDGVGPQTGSADGTERTPDPVRNGTPATSPTSGGDAAGADRGEPDRGRGDDGADASADEAGRDTGDEPEEFRTVLRLLGNREFPVERDAVVELATNAYELDDAHVRECLDYAADRGVLDDDDGLLYRG